MKIGLAFLEAKGKEEGVVTLPSGLLYKELTPGKRKCRCDGMYYF